MNASTQYANHQFYKVPDHHRVITVPRPAVRNKVGINRNSRRSIIREARRMAGPEFANAGAIEVIYGSNNSVDTVVILDSTITIHQGLV